MEKLKLSPRCKLCTLFRRDTALWEEVHRRVLVQAESRSEVCKWLNSRIDVLNVGHDPSDLDNYIPPFVSTTLHRHFRVHVITQEEMERALSVGVQFTSLDDGRSGRGEDNVIPFALPSELSEPGEKVEDYCRMSQLVQAAEVRLTDYNTRLQEKAEDEDSPDVDLSEIQLFQKLIKELMGMQKELAVLQSSRAIAGDAIQSAIEQLVSVTFSTLKDVLIEMKVNIAREMPGSTLPDQMQGMVLNKMGNKLKDAVPFILESTYKKYKIR